MLTEPSVATVLPVIQTPWQNQWQPELIGTLVFLVDNERVLLIEKLTGHGQGKINGPVRPRSLADFRFGAAAGPRRNAGWPFLAGPFFREFVPPHFPVRAGNAWPLYYARLIKGDGRLLGCQ